MSAEKEKKLFYEYLPMIIIGYFCILIFCICFFGIGFDKIWKMLIAFFYLSVENWFVSLPILGMIIGAALIGISSITNNFAYGFMLFMGSMLILEFLSVPALKMAKNEQQEQSQIEIIQPEKNEKAKRNPNN